VCNNSYSTDEEARIAYARQGKPLDGSALITCSPGYTLSIDYGRPSYAKCVDFRVNLDAPDNPWGTIQPTTSQTDTRTVTTQTDTRTVTTQTDTRTVTTQTDTRTVTTQTTSSSQSETRTAQIAEIASISNVKARTIETALLINTYEQSDKEKSLTVIAKSNKSVVMTVATEIPGVTVLLTATKKNSKPITFTRTTNDKGLANVTTRLPLSGYLITFSINGVKIDSDPILSIRGKI
jgi:hypothetical protein